MIFDMGRTFGVPKWIMYEINAWYDFGMVYATPETSSLGDNPDLTSYLTNNNCFVIASPSNESGERAIWDEYGVRLVQVDYPELIFTVNDANMDEYEFYQSDLNGLRGLALIIPFTLGDDADSVGNAYWERTNIINVSDTSALLSKSGGTMSGQLVAQNNSNYTTYQVRNIALSTSAATPTGLGALLGVYS